MNVPGLLTKLNALPADPDRNGRFKCPLCGTRSFFPVPNTPYLVCTHCHIKLDPIQLAAKVLNVDEGRAEDMFLPGQELEGPFSLASYEAEYRLGRSDFLSCQAELEAMVSQGARDLRSTGYGASLAADFLAKTIPPVDVSSLPRGLGVAPSGLPHCMKDIHISPGSAMVPYALHGVLTHVDFVEARTGKISSFAPIPTRHGLFPDISGVARETAYVVQSPQLAAAFHAKMAAASSILLPLAHQAVQPMPLDVDLTVLVDCQEGPLPLSVACQYLGMSGPRRRIAVSTIRQPLRSIRSIRLRTVLDRHVDLASWLASRLNALYLSGSQSLVYEALHAMPVPSARKEELMDAVKALPGFAGELVELLASSIREGPSTTIHGNTVVVRGVSTDVVYPSRANLVDAGIFVNAGVVGRKYAGFDVTICMSDTPALDMLLSMDDLRSETALAERILREYMSKLGIARMPLFNRHSRIPWNVLVPKLSERKPVIPLVQRLGFSKDRLCFPRCGFDTALDTLSAAGRGMVQDIPDHIAGYWSQVVEPAGDHLEFLRRLYASRNIYDIGLTTVLGHMLHGMASSVHRKHYRPQHMVVADRDERFWDVSLQALHGSLHYERRVPALPTAVGEMERFMGHYSALGTLPLVVQATESCGRNISYLLDNVDMPLVIGATEQVAARLSGDSRLCYLVRPPLLQPAEKSVALSSPEELPQAIPWLIQHVLQARREVARGYSPIPERPARESICAWLEIPYDSYADQFCSETYTVYQYNRAEDMFHRLRQILDAPTPSSERALLATEGPLEELTEDYIGVATTKNIHLHKDRAVRLLNSQERRFNKATIEAELGVRGMLAQDPESAAWPDCWSIPRKIWALLVSPVCPRNRELQIREMLAGNLSACSMPEALWTSCLEPSTTGTPSLCTILPEAVN